MAHERSSYEPIVVEDWAVLDVGIDWLPQHPILGIPDSGRLRVRFDVAAKSAPRQHPGLQREPSSRVAYAGPHVVSPILTSTGVVHGGAHGR